MRSRASIDTTYFARTILLRIVIKRIKPLYHHKCEMTTNRDVNELYSEACACMEQGLCYDEIDDIVSFACFYSVLVGKESMQRLKRKNFSSNGNCHLKVVHF